MHDPSAVTQAGCRVLASLGREESWLRPSSNPTRSDVNDVGVRLRPIAENRDIEWAHGDDLLQSHRAIDDVMKRPEQLPPAPPRPAYERRIGEGA